MPKRNIYPGPNSTLPKNKWLDLTRLAQVEVSSEIPTRPVDDALVPGLNSGWSASQSGKQTVRLYFDEPRELKKIHLAFKEDHHQRTQEFVLRYSEDGTAYRDIVRQQYNFNPPVVETEEYDVNLEKVAALELEIVPEISGGWAIASLAEWRLK